MRCLYYPSEQQTTKEMIIPALAEMVGGKHTHNSSLATSTENACTTFLSLSSPSFQNISTQRFRFFVVVKKLLERN